MDLMLEPRQVDKPFERRWLRLTLQLFIRSPVRFGIAIALLGWLDSSAVTLARGYAVEWIWIARLGMLILPLLWVFISALARGADDASRSREALAGLLRRQVWVGALTTGAALAAFNWIIFWALEALFATSRPHRPESYLQHPGELVNSIAAQIWLVSMWCGLCFFPLLVLVPELSTGHARQLSQKATVINGTREIGRFFLVIMVGAWFLGSLVPAYGMTSAAILVFIGILNYVAYRDIFERRSENVPQVVRGAYAPGRVEVIPVAHGVPGRE